MAKANISREDFLVWDQFCSKPASDALPIIYKRALDFSKQAREWYWVSIRVKRRASLVARSLTWSLIAFGIIAPLYSSIVHEPSDRLWITQLGVIAIVLAGLLQLADRVFGWSSGWLRYVTTVTAMEQIVLQFEIDWASYLVTRTAHLSVGDIKRLFELASKLQLDLDKRRSEETQGWVAEFNVGMAALNDMIKVQREAAEKASEGARAIAETNAEKQRTGAIQVTIAQEVGSSDPVVVYLDGVQQATATGSTWASLGIAPGLHSLRVVRNEGTQNETSEMKIVDVSPSGVASLDLHFS